MSTALSGIPGGSRSGSADPRANPTSKPENGEAFPTISGPGTIEAGAMGKYNYPQVEGHIPYSEAADYLARAKELLDRENVPEKDRWLILPKFLTGKIGRIDGFKFYPSG
jgi:hypothetical protein